MLRMPQEESKEGAGEREMEKGVLFSLGCWCSTWSNLKPIEKSCGCRTATLLPKTNVTQAKTGAQLPNHPRPRLPPFSPPLKHTFSSFYLPRFLL